MEIVKIVLKDGDSSEEVLALFSVKTCPAKKIAFVCPRDFSLMTDTGFLKKIKKAATKSKKKIVFVTEQEFLRDSIAGQKLVAVEALPEEFRSAKKMVMADFSDAVTAQKNVETPHVKQEKSSAPLKFSTQKISAGYPGKSIRGHIFFGIILTIVILFGLYFWIAPSSTVILKSKIAAVPVTQNIIVGLPEAEIGQENEELPLIPGIFVETSIIGTERFASSGRTYEVTNAFGQVSLFNETSKPKFLLPSRLETEDGVIFRFRRSITIPPKADGNAGQAVVDVFADDYDEEGAPIGNRGNIMAGTPFVFPALRRESRELYYAKANRGPLVGGSTLTHYFVREEDFAVAEKLLTDTFRFRGIQALQKEIENQSAREGEKYILLNDSRLLRSELFDVVFPVESIDQEMQTFEVSGKLKLSGLVFNQAVVSKFLKKKVLASLDKRKKLIEIDPTSAQFRLLEFEEFDKKKWVKLSAKMIGVETLDLSSKEQKAVLWREELKKEIAGKAKRDALGILTNKPEIENVVKIKISPFWQKTFPRIFNQINFEIVD